MPQVSGPESIDNISDDEIFSTAEPPPENSGLKSISNYPSIIESELLESKYLITRKRFRSYMSVLIFSEVQTSMVTTTIMLWLIQKLNHDPNSNLNFMWSWERADSRFYDSYRYMYSRLYWCPRGLTLKKVIHQCYIIYTYAQAFLDFWALQNGWIDY